MAAIEPPSNIVMAAIETPSKASKPDTEIVCRWGSYTRISCHRAESPGDIPGQSRNFLRRKSERIVGNVEGLAINVGGDTSRDVSALGSASFYQTRCVCTGFQSVHTPKRLICCTQSFFIRGQPGVVCRSVSTCVTAIGAVSSGTIGMLSSGGPVC